MKIELSRGALALPEDFAVEIKKSNPFFSDEGSFSIPSSIPATPHNLAVAAHPERVTMSHRFNRRFPAILKGPFMQKKGSLLIDKVQDGAMNVAMLLDESEMYSGLKEVNLKDIFVDQCIFGGVTKMEMSSIHEGLWSLYETGLLQYPYTSESRELACFPVVVKDGDKYHFLNEPNAGGDGFVYEARKIYSNDTEYVNVPEGYGLTCFLRLHHAIRLMFELRGFEVVGNDFNSEPWNKLVLLNNCSDAALSDGTYHCLTYSDMVPSITIGEFLTALKDKFGASVFVSGNEVRIKLLQWSLSPDHTNADIDLTQYVVDDCGVSYPSQSKLTLNMGTSIEGAKPINDTLEEAVYKYRSRSSSVLGGLLHYDPVTGNYSFVRNGEQQASGSNAFKFDRTFDGITESEDISSSDEFVPMIKMPDGLAYPFIGERRNSYTNINGAEESQNQAMLLCWFFDAPEDGKFCSASTQPYDKYGNFQYYQEFLPVPDGESRPVPRAMFALTPEELYSRTHSLYADMLLSGTPTLTVKAKLPYPLLAGLRMDLPKYFCGSRVMVISLSYSVHDGGVPSVDMELRHICDYSDAIPIPVVKFQVSGYWKYVNTKSSLDLTGYLSVLDDGKTDYSPSQSGDDYPKPKPTLEGEKAKYRKRYVRVWGYGMTDWRILEYEEYFLGVVYSA